MELQDGKNGNKEPRVTHGYTLTGDISFAEVCEVLKRDAFIHSPFPVVLSFEMHASLEQQAKAAKHMETIIGLDNIYFLPENWTYEMNLPSPEDLKYKFLLKIKGNPKKKLEMLLGKKEKEEAHSTLGMKTANSKTTYPSKWLRK